MNKFTKNNLIGIIIFLLGSSFLLSRSVGYLGDGLSILTGIVITLITIISLVWTFNDDWDNEKGNKKEVGYIKIGKIPLILTLGLLLYFVSGFISKSTTIYNTNKVVSRNYEQKTISRLGFYDNMWKTYCQKDKITNVSKDVFLEVARIQMENRKDGAAVTWKWVQENSPIPYEEFTKFYSDLSTFIESKREGYYKLEMECQALAASQNLLIDTFPNNIYNKVLDIKPIVFKYGMLSDSTNQVFSKGIENVK